MATKQSKPEAIFEAIKEAQQKLASNLHRGFTMAHIFQHAHITRKEAGKEVTHELQQAATWPMINDNELKAILSDFHFDATAEMIFSVRQLVAFKLIVDHNPIAKEASKDMIEAAKFADKLLNLKAMTIKEKTRKSSGTSYSGKSYSA